MRRSKISSKTPFMSQITFQFLSILRGKHGIGYYNFCNRTIPCLSPIAINRTEGKSNSSTAHISILGSHRGTVVVWSRGGVIIGHTNNCGSCQTGTGGIGGHIIPATTTIKCGHIWSAVSTSHKEITIVEAIK